MKYFQYQEFDSPDLPGSGNIVSQKLINKLEEAREIAGIPFIVNSGYRSIAWNKKVGGKPNSSHLKGLACDIAASDSKTRYKVLNACIKAGFKRIGIANGFIHVDIDESKVSGVIWLY